MSDQARFEMVRGGHDWKVSVASSTHATWRERTRMEIEFVNLYTLGIWMYNV